jgi:hypothetical protein
MQLGKNLPLQVVIFAAAAHKEVGSQGAQTGSASSVLVL